ncbi:asparaginase [Ornithinimicrobium sp. W1679]|uniref:asparaginase n=1 Tax=Ornithinimicrobium sp. W1679 TaxID=3418770 RepID=UPI003CF56F9D
MTEEDAGRARRVLVLGTGGTIASTSADGSGAVASLTARDLLGELAPMGIEVETDDMFTLGSYLLEHRHLRQVVEAVAAACTRDDVDGVVLTHGTDAVEETGFLLSLCHRGDKPVVLTGAQRSADQADTDGPRNLRDAVVVAADPRAEGMGPLLVFAGLVLPGGRFRKAHTLAPQPFAVPDGGPLGTVGEDGVHLHSRPVRHTPPLSLTTRFDTTRVDVVTLHPGADAALARAAVEAGAAAVVLAGTGAGNGNHALLQWVTEAVDHGVTVGVSTRVAEGPVAPLYGNGGARDLLDAGALSMGALPLFHARLLLAALRSTGEQVTQEVVDRFA